MRTLPLLATLLLVVAANAQTPPGSGGGGDPHDRSKTGTFIQQKQDELAHQKQMDAAHVALRSAAFRDALRNYAPGKLPELRVNWGEFITATGRVFVALQLAPPAASGLRADGKVITFGEVRNATGTVVLDFEEQARIEESKGDAFIERSLLQDVRGATGTFGIARGGEILAVGRATFDFAAPEKSTAGISPLLVSNNVYNLPRIQKPLEPFAFGGTKVVPKPDGAFRAGDEIWLFTDLRNPALGDDKKPKVTAKIDVEGNGKKMRGAPMTIDASPLKGVEGHYGLGTTVDLSSLPRGAYKVKLTIRDEIAQQSYEREATIRLVD